jgi:HEPN domain-containing protein
MKNLEPHITKSRYPVRKGPKLLPPSELYTLELAKSLKEDSSRVFGLAERFLQH